MIRRRAGALRDPRRERVPAAAELSDTENESSKPRRVRPIARAIPRRPRRKSESRVSAQARNRAHEMRFPVSRETIAAERQRCRANSRPLPALPRGKARSGNAGAMRGRASRRRSSRDVYRTGDRGQPSCRAVIRISQRESSRCRGASPTDCSSSASRPL